MNFPLDRAPAATANAASGPEAADRLRNWLKRYIATFGRPPDPKFSFPPIVAWLVEQVTSRSNLLPGSSDAGFLVSFMLIEHALNWTRGFQDRLLLDDAYGDRGASFTKERQELGGILAKIEADLVGTTLVFEPGAPAFAFQTLFASRPAGAATFLHEISQQWHLSTAALKFGLVGGFDAAVAIKGQCSQEEFAELVAKVVACDSHAKFSIPKHISSGEITPRKIGYALRETHKYPRTGLDLFGIVPRFAAFTQPLCLNKNSRGMKWGEPADCAASPGSGCNNHSSHEV